MVRINIISPKKLSDQHLIAEYNEILMLLAYVRKYPKMCGDAPKKYCLGTGHIKFFKNKLLYLKKRHDLIKEEMKMRNFTANKTVSIKKFDKKLQKDWVPDKKDFEIIKKRLKWKLEKKPDYYRYCSEKKHKKFFIKMIE